MMCEKTMRGFLLILVICISMVSATFGSSGPVIDLYTQRGGAGPNQPSDAFAPGEQVILFAYVTYNNAPVEGKLVAFEVHNPTSTYVVYRTGETDMYGLATANFTIPTAYPPHEIIGTWTAIAVVEVAEQTVSDTLTFLVAGAMIDLYTQKEPYSGRGPNQPSDAFAPQEEVALYAYVTYNLDPVQNKLVAFEVRDPTDASVVYRSENTNASGIAEVRYRIPTGALFGTWSAIATVEVLGTTLNDTLTFRVGWIVEILQMETVNQYAETKTTFARGEHIYFNLTIQNIAFVSKIVTFTIVVCDDAGVPIGQVMLNGWLIPPEISVIFIIDLPIPNWAFLGLGNAFANAYTSMPTHGGIPYSPEISATFLIVKA